MIVLVVVVLILMVVVAFVIELKYLTYIHNFTFSRVTLPTSLLTVFSAQFVVSLYSMNMLKEYFSKLKLFLTVNIIVHTLYDVLCVPLTVTVQQKQTICAAV